MEILIYTVSYKKYISLKAVAQICSISKVFLQILQNSLKNTCARVTFIIMLHAVASVPCQEYIKDKFLTQRSDLPFENFILYLRCGVDIRRIFRTLPDI